MRTRALLLGFLCLGSWLYSQKGFSLPSPYTKDKISFELVNNLVIIPVEINGAKLSFLLDTGVNATLLFSFENVDSVQLNNTRAVKIQGLGKGGSIDAFLSNNNQMKVGKAVDNQHTIYMVMDQNINFSTRMGIPIHGILGFDFFRRFVVKTDYAAKRITFYNPSAYKKRRCRNCMDFDLTFHANKPYLNTIVRSLTGIEDVTLLIDSGSSDGLWLFDEEDFIKEDPKNYFQDFLGLGLSGNIFGKRTKINNLRLGKFELKEVTTSFPDSIAIRNIKNFDERDGSLGSEVLRRFTVVMDYRNKQMTLKKNRSFNDPFHYNMAGLILQHDGLIPVQDIKYSRKNTITMAEERREASSIIDLYASPTIEFFLAPKFVVAEVREGSPADMAGIMQGDEVISINGKASYKYKLSELVLMFTSKAGRTITMEISRGETVFKKKFVLKEVL
jgi:hypothetical protein